MNKAMPNADLIRLLEVIDYQFKDYTYSQIAIALTTALLYAEHVRVSELPNADYVNHMEKATAAIITSIISSLSASVLHNIPTERVN